MRESLYLWMNLFEREDEDEDYERLKYAAAVSEAKWNPRNLSSFVTFQHCVTTPHIERVMNFFGGLMQIYITS